MSKTANIAEKVRALITAAVTEAGYVLWDVEFAKEGPDDTLFVLIDSPAGIGLDDCEKVTHLIDPILDEADPIPQSYYLEVSSPGSERTLKREEHFLAMLGKPVTALLYAPLDGKKELSGILEAYENGTVTLAGVTLEKGTYSSVKTVDEMMQ